MSHGKVSLAVLAALVMALSTGCNSNGAAPRPASAKAPARPRLDRSVPELASAVNQPLPPVDLVNLEGARLPDESFRRGKVVLIFVNPTCTPCNKEAEFLRTVIDKRPDITFYGVATLGEKEESLKLAAEMFPFKTFYDEGARLTQKLGITRMPIKMYVEDGVVKETWGGASTKPEVQADFVAWMEDVK